MTRSRKIVKINIENILGIDRLEIKPDGKNIIITGDNGEGKSSIFRALQSVLRGGTRDAQLLRNGEKIGETVLVLEDSTEITKTITNRATEVQVRDEHGAMNKAASRIKSMFSHFCANPVEFLLAKPAERVKILLQSLNLKANPAEIKDICGITPESPEALTAIQECRARIYDKRHDINTLARDAEARKKNLFEQAAAIELEEIDVDAAQAAIEQIEADYNEAATQARNKTKDATKALREKNEKKQAEIAARQRHIAQNKEKIKTHEATRDASILELQQSRDAAKAPHQQKIQQATDMAVLLTHKQKYNEDAKTEGNKADQLNKESTELTLIIETLDAYKAELLESLPIKGLEVTDGEIYYNGINYETLNDAARVELAVKIAILNKGDVPLILIDNAELLSTKNFTKLLDTINENDCQALLTRVSDTPLKITHE